MGSGRAEQIPVRSAQAGELMELDEQYVKDRARGLERLQNVGWADGDATKHRRVCRRKSRFEAEDSSALGR